MEDCVRQEVIVEGSDGSRNKTGFSEQLSESRLTRTLGNAFGCADSQFSEWVGILCLVDSNSKVGRKNVVRDLAWTKGAEPPTTPCSLRENLHLTSRVPQHELLFTFFGFYCSLLLSISGTLAFGRTGHPQIQ